MRPTMNAGQAIGMTIAGGLGVVVSMSLCYGSWTGRMSGFVSFVPLGAVAPLGVLAGAALLVAGARELSLIARAAAQGQHQPTGPALLIATVVIGVLGLEIARRVVLPVGTRAEWPVVVFPVFFNPLVWIALWCGFWDQISNRRPTGWVALGVVAAFSVVLAVVLFVR